MSPAPVRPDLVVRRRKDKERRVRALQGDLVVSTGPVIAHMARLQAAGWTSAQISAAAGIARSTPFALVKQETTKRHIATSVLRVRVGPPPVESTHTHVDSTGARRRVEALGVLGWSPERIAARAGLSRGPVYRALQGRPISVASESALRVVFDELWDVPASGGRSAVITARALAAGWAPPLAWDDDTIDDPSATPEGVPPREESRGNRKVNVDAVAEHLELNPGATLRQVAERVGVRKETLRRNLERNGHRDLLVRMTRNAVAAGCSNQHTARSVAA